MAYSCILTRVRTAEVEVHVQADDRGSIPLITAMWLSYSGLVHLLDVQRAGGSNPSSHTN